MKVVFTVPYKILCILLWLSDTKLKKSAATEFFEFFGVRTITEGIGSL